MLITKPLKPRPCKHCKSSFTPTKRMQVVCSPLCGLERARIQREAKERKEHAARKRVERAMDRKTREAQKTLPMLHREAQAAFNALRREQCRHAGYGCISCGRPLDWGHEGVRSHAVDAGHYRSVGSAPQLRYTSANVWPQCVSCNRYGAGKAVDYRIGLVARIGVEAVEALESFNEVHKWTKEEVRAIRDESRAALRQLKKEQA